MAAAAATPGPPGPTASPTLLLAVHTVQAATAKVPFAMILLLDFAKRKATPPGSKCRMVIPSDGLTSISLWDSSDRAALQEWLQDNLGGDCHTELHEVQEDFTWGLALELARMRAAEKTIGALGETTSKAAGVLAAGVSTAVGTTQQKLEAFDQRTGVITSAKETTSAIAHKAIEAMSKAAEDRRVQSVVGHVSTGVSSGWAKLTNFVGTRMQDLAVHDGAEEFGAPHERGYDASSAQAHMPAPYVTAPPPPVAATAAAPPPPRAHTLGSDGGSLGVGGAPAPAQQPASGSAGGAAS